MCYATQPPVSLGIARHKVDGDVYNRTADSCGTTADGCGTPPADEACAGGPTSPTGDHTAASEDLLGALELLISGIQPDAAIVEELRHVLSCSATSPRGASTSTGGGSSNVNSPNKLSTAAAAAAAVMAGPMPAAASAALPPVATPHEVEQQEACDSPAAGSSALGGGGSGSSLILAPGTPSRATADGGAGSDAAAGRPPRPPRRGLPPRRSATFVVSREGGSAGTVGAASLLGAAAAARARAAAGGVRSDDGAGDDSSSSDGAACEAAACVVPSVTAGEREAARQQRRRRLGLGPSCFTSSRADAVRARLNQEEQAFEGEEGDELDAARLLTLSEPRILSTLASADAWQWDAFALDTATRGRALSTLGLHLISGAGLVEAVGIDGIALARWLRAVETSYGDHPFHNRVHAADALQTMHVLLTRGGLLDLLQRDPLAHLAALLAAAVHDFRHRGVSNDFLVATGDELAITYNDVSPQENEHASAALRLMQQPEFNFLAPVAPAAARRLRRLIIRAVLATDMKQHFPALSAFQGLLADLARRGAAALARSQDLVISVALKVADVGHMMAHWEVHKAWVGRLEEEMYRQGDLERSLGLPVSPLMDRAHPGASSSQAGFLTVVVLPLLHAWTTLLPAAGPLLYAAMSNRAGWEGEAIAAKARAKAAAAEAAAVAAAAVAASARPGSACCGVASSELPRARSG